MLARSMSVARFSVDGIDSSIPTAVQSKQSRFGMSGHLHLRRFVNTQCPLLPRIRVGIGFPPPSQSRIQLGMLSFTRKTRCSCIPTVLSPYTQTYLGCGQVSVNSSKSFPPQSPQPLVKLFKRRPSIRSYQLVSISISNGRGTSVSPHRKLLN